MKKLFTILTTLALLCVVGCEEQGDDNVNPNDKPNTEQPGEKPDDGSGDTEEPEEQKPENIFFGLDRESVSISPDGGSVDVVVYSNYKWEISGTSDWCTPSATSGEANEDGQKVTFSADVTYDTREAIFWFRCADEKIKFVVSQNLKEVIIADENNTFSVPSEGGIVTIAYQTSVECEVIIPDEAKEWITFANADATRGLVAENINLNIAENTTYSARSAVIKVVAVDNKDLMVEYTINQVQNDAIIADENNTFNVPSEGGVVEIAYQTNVECEIIIPEEAKSWISLTPATRALVSESATLTVAENTTYSARSAVVKVVRVGDNTLFAEYTINQVQNDALIADENNTFNVPSEGGVVEIAYQTNVECEIIIPEEAQSWISLAPATRALVSELATLTVAENTTYSARSAVVKVVRVGDNTLYAEYTINQVQNDAIIAKDNTFNLKGWAQSINIAYQTNVECEVVIPEEAQSWITLAPATRALVNESVTLNIAENNTGAERSAVVQVVAANNNELVAEYTITQNQRYFMEYTSADGYTVSPNDSSALDATIIRNEYIDGKGYIDFDAPITSIGNKAFYERSSLKSVTIPDSVTSIGEDAFSNCTSLTSITIPDSVTSIGDWAFDGCTSLTSVTIGNGVTSIGDYAFYDCTSLTSVHTTDIAAWCGISFSDYFANPLYYANNLYLNGELVTNLVIPESVTSIGYSAFEGCSSLTSVTIPDSVTSIGEDAFYECTSLTSITIPDSVTSIGDYAFYLCSSLTSITIPDSVTSIGDWAFYYCSSLTSITIPDSVTSIEKGAFYGCTSLTSITIPDSVTKIGDSAFNACTGELIINSKIVETNYTDSNIPSTYGWLESAKFSKLTIGDSVTEIGSYAFNGCTSLRSITIPESVTEIGSSAFNGCTSLTSITIPESVTEIGSSAFDGCTSLTSITIPDGVTEIGSSAFDGCTSLTSVTIGSGVTEIGSWAFYGCTSLTSVAIPESVIEIGYRSFSDCTSLRSVYITDIAAWCGISFSDYDANPLNYAHNLYLNGELVTNLVIPDGVTKIGWSAFGGCSSLTSITIPDSVTSIGGSAFSGCTGELIINSKLVETNYTDSNGWLKSAKFSKLTIGDSITSIGNYAFCDCSSLTSITIPDSVTTIGSYAFRGCSSLTSITIPDSVTKIGGYAFYGCSSLTSITIPDSVTSIVGYAFYNCKSLTSITIPDSVTSIGSYAFRGCSSLTSITIPDSVTSIGKYAFEDCTSLTSITIPDSVTSIGNYAFCDCTSLTSITIPDSVTTIGDYAFYDCTSLTSVHITDIAAWCGISFGYNGANPLYYAHNLYLNGDLVTDLVIPDSVTSIGSYAFADCTSLTSITIPDSVTSIGSSAFHDCTSLTSIIIPDSVTSIGGYAFDDCSSLTSVTIGNGVTSIGDSAFRYCTSLTSVYCKAVTPPAGDSDMFYYNASGRKIYVPTESVDAYKKASYWNDYKSYIYGYDFE